MYRIRKEWNNGKWSKDQIGAYSVLQTAIANCSDEDVMAGYRVFDETGKIVYPVLIDSVAQMMIDDQVTVDGEYWTDVLQGVTPANPDYLRAIIQRYHEALTAEALNDTYQVVMFDNIPMFKLNVDKFKIVWVDKDKSFEMPECALAFNLGYFANFFAEGGVKFTLPIANLVADINFNEISPCAVSYIKERPHTDTRVAFSTHNNASGQFKGKSVSTLIVKDGEARIESVKDVTLEEVDYAVSGAPIIRKGKFSETAYKAEGWDSSVSRSTYHGFIGIRHKELFYFYLNTLTSNCITSGEVYDRVKNFGFEDLIKVDGGGSFDFRCEAFPQYDMKTTNSRQINNIGGVFNER